jgi:FkbM family methyltransferase
MKASALIAACNRLPLWRRRLRVWGGTFEAPTFDRWIYLWMHRLGRMGREEADFFRRAVLPGMHVADVGANLGLYSVLLANLVGPPGRVFAFEPDGLMARALRTNLALNRVAHAEVFELAIGAGPGRVLLQRNAVNSGDNRVGRDTGTALHSEQVSVAAGALQDALRGRRLDFIKMDVQGWEGEALRGVAGLLDANPGLQIYFEFWPYGLRRAGTEIPQLASSLRELGLRVTRAEAANEVRPVDVVELDRGMRPKAFTNLLARRR